jgi:DNA-binding NtrC family response regulator
MSQMRELLVLEPDPAPCREHGGEALASLVERSLASSTVSVRSGCLPDSVTGPAPDLVLVSYGTGRRLSSAVESLARRWRATPVVGCFCSHRERPSAVRGSLTAGVDDFVCCPVRPIDLVPRIERLLGGAVGEAASGDAPGPPGAPGRGALAALKGESERFLEVIALLPRLAAVDAPVLVTGETGTGKELVARAIHYQSRRRGHAFVAVDCGALPDHLVENELFGHERGAYTDAGSRADGLVAEAAGGTLFLDEIDSLSATAQSKLLRFLQTREYRPVGSSRSREADLRIVVATNAHLPDRVRDGSFRRDLYYRLNVLSVRLPPLRERVGDVSVLARHFVHRFRLEYGRPEIVLAPSGLDRLEAHPWPGNVRELETAIQRSVLLAPGGRLGADDLDLPGVGVGDGGGGGPLPATASFQEAKTDAIERFERAYLLRSLAAADGNVSQAARAAGKERRSFQRLLAKHGIDKTAFC